MNGTHDFRGVYSRNSSLKQNQSNSSSRTLKTNSSTSPQQSLPPHLLFVRPSSLAPIQHCTLREHSEAVRDIRATHGALVEEALIIKATGLTHTHVSTRQQHHGLSLRKTYTAILTFLSLSIGGGGGGLSICCALFSGLSGCRCLSHSPCRIHALALALALVVLALTIYVTKRGGRVGVDLIGLTGTMVCAPPAFAPSHERTLPLPARAPAPPSPCAQPPVQPASVPEHVHSMRCWSFFAEEPSAAPKEAAYLSEQLRSRGGGARGSAELWALVSPLGLGPRAATE